MEKVRATEENFLEVFDDLTSMEAFELARYIVRCYEEESQEFPYRLLEKPWNFPEILVPALNWELEGKVREIIWQK